MVRMILWSNVGQDPNVVSWINSLKNDKFDKYHK